MALNKNVYRLKIDIKSPRLNVVPSFVQYDDARLEFEVFDGGMPYDITGFTSVQFAHKRPDGSVIVGPGEIAVDEYGNNIVRYDYQGSEMHELGTISTSFSLIDAEADKVSVHPFRVLIVDDLQDGAVDPANPEYGVLQQLIAQVQLATDTAEAATADTILAATEARTAAGEVTAVIATVDAKIAEATTATDNAAIEAASARAAAEAANDAATLATTATGDAVAATTDALDASADARTATTEAEVATQEADEATTNAIAATQDALELKRVGEYNAATQYRKGNEVGLNGSSFIALKDTIGNAPVVGGVLDATNWAVRAQKGLDGLGSVVTVNGEGPDGNGNVQLDIATSFNDLLDVPTEFTPEAHTHMESDITDLGAKSPITTQINRGSRIITVSKGTPANVLNFTGKTIINLAPLFDSGLWESGTPSKVTTNSSNKVTITITDGVLAYHSTKNVQDVIPVKANTQYTLSVKHNANISVIDAMNFNNVIVPSTSNQTVTFNSGTYTSLRVALTSLSANGTYTFENVMLNEGSTAQEFVANVKGVTNPTIENKTTGDAITVVGTFHTGEVVDVANKKVTRVKREVVLGGSLAWEAGASHTGFKVVALKIPTGFVSGSSTVVKYNGKVLEKNDDLNVRADTQRLLTFDNYLHITVANADSGWGPDYIPTVAEVQAFMYGWRMTYLGASNSEPYNGTGTKAWTDMGGTASFTTVLPTTQVSLTGKWRPYRLLHDLVTPVTESVKTIGSLRLSSGDNTVELTEGRIVRERLKPSYSSMYSMWFINGVNEHASSEVKYRKMAPVGVYKNGVLDSDGFYDATLVESGKKWGFNKNNHAINIASSDFDPTAIYELDYIPLEPYKVSSYATPITINYRDTLGGVAEELVEDVTTLTSRISSNESAIGELIGGNSVHAKKTPDAWKSAILQNGWSGSLLYRVNPIGQLEMRMVLTVGTGSGLTTVAEIPNIPVPNANVFSLMNNSTGEIYPGRLFVDSAGRVRTSSSDTVNFITGDILLATTVIPSLT